MEAFAEALHREMRMKLWGYAKDEELCPEDLLKIKYDLVSHSWAIEQELIVWERESIMGLLWHV